MDTKKLATTFVITAAAVVVGQLIVTFAVAPALSKVAK